MRAAAMMKLEFLRCILDSLPGWLKLLIGIGTRIGDPLQERDRCCVTPTLTLFRGFGTMRRRAMIESDAETIAGFLRGDAAAAALIDGWLASAAGAFRSRLGAHWEDLLQDARLEILRQLRRGSFRGESSLKTYVWRVTLHACLNRLRARRRWRFEELNFDLEPTRDP